MVRNEHRPNTERRGTCPVCHYRYGLTKVGRIGSHYIYYGQADRKLCSGSWAEPWTPERRTEHAE